VRDGRVEQPLELRVGAWGDGVVQRPPDAPQRFDRGFRAGVADAEAQDGPAVEALGDERERRRQAQVEDRGQLVGRAGDEGAVLAQDLGSVVEGVVDRAREDGADVVQAVLERGRDAEVPAAPAQAPEQLGVLVGARADPVAVDGASASRCRRRA
jgi:hypothetical protein